MEERTQPTVRCSVCQTAIDPNAARPEGTAYRVEQVKSYGVRGLFVWYCSIKCLREWLAG